MRRKVSCCKFKQTLEGLEAPPFPGVMGEKIFNSVSRQAWDMWLAHQTMLINEYRLNVLDNKARKFLTEEMQHFLFITESPVENL